MQLTLRCCGDFSERIERILLEKISFLKMEEDGDAREKVVEEGAKAEARFLIG